MASRINASTQELLITQADEQWMGVFTSTLHLKSHKAKAFLSIGGGNSGSYIFSNMVSTRENRAAFIESTIEVARKYNFDGLDLDWEFPNNHQDMSNLSALLKEWRAVIDREAGIVKSPLLLSASVYFASKLFLTDPTLTYPGYAIKEYVDFVSPMCFDYRGGWNTSVTGAPALLYDKSSNISTSFGITSWIENGVPPDKLVMGMLMYGRTWTLKNPKHHGIGAAAVGVGPGDNGVMSYSDIVEFNKENHSTVVYDRKTVSTYSYAGSSWIGYDDVISIQNKIKFAKDENLGGYFFWALGDDYNSTLSRAASLAWDGRG